jgi:hypothetical protein
MFGFSPEFKQYMTEQPVIPGGKGSVVGRTAMTGGTVQIADVMTDPDYQISDRIRIGNVRTLLGVPLLLDGVIKGDRSAHRACCTLVQPGDSPSAPIPNAFH